MEKALGSERHPVRHKASEEGKGTILESYDLDDMHRLTFGEFKAGRFLTIEDDLAKRVMNIPWNDAVDVARWILECEDKQKVKG